MTEPGHVLNWDNQCHDPPSLSVEVPPDCPQIPPPVQNPIGFLSGAIETMPLQARVDQGRRQQFAGANCQCQQTASTAQLEASVCILHSPTAFDDVENIQLHGYAQPVVSACRSGTPSAGRVRRHFLTNPFLFRRQTLGTSHPAPTPTTERSGERELGSGRLLWSSASLPLGFDQCGKPNGSASVLGPPFPGACQRLDDAVECPDARTIHSCSFHFSSAVSHTTRRCPPPLLPLSCCHSCPPPSTRSFYFFSPSPHESHTHFPLLRQ